MTVDLDLLLMLSLACRDNCRDARALADVRRAQCSGLACSALRKAADWWDDASLACHAARHADNDTDATRQMDRAIFAVDVACNAERAAVEMARIW